MNKAHNIKVSLVILNRNDAECLKLIYPRIPLESIDEIMVIDGKSEDNSVDICRELGIRVIVQDKLGRGEAFRIAAKEIKGDYVIFLSSDGNEDPTDIPKFIRTLAEGYDMVIASRLLPGARNKDSGKFFPIRIWMQKLFSLLVNMIWGGNLSDVWNGYRAFNADKLRLLPSSADWHLIELEQTIRALKLGYKIAEFPTIEGDRLFGRSRIPFIRTGFGLIIILIREIFTKIK